MLSNLMFIYDVLLRCYDVILRIFLSNCFCPRNHLLRKINIYKVWCKVSVSYFYGVDSISKTCSLLNDHAFLFKGIVRRE